MACPASPDDDHSTGYSSVAVEHDEGCDEQDDVTDRLLLGLLRRRQGKGPKIWMDGWWSKEAGELLSCSYPVQSCLYTQLCLNGGFN